MVDGHDWEPFVVHLLSAPDSQLDDTMKAKILKWSRPYRAIDVLEVLDLCTHSSLSSGIVVTCLKMMYEDLLVQEHTTHEEVVKNATWREEKDRV